MREDQDLRDEVRERDARREEGRRAATSDRAMVRLDEAEIKARMLEAFDKFVRIGFAAHLIGSTERAAIVYRIALYPDGMDTIPSSILQDTSDEFRLDYTIERGRGDGWAIMLYPRW